MYVFLTFPISFLATFFVTWVIAPRLKKKGMGYGRLLISTSPLLGSTLEKGYPAVITILWLNSSRASTI
jgi:hypothetical protein